MKKKNKEKEKLSAKDYESIGKLVVLVGETGYRDKKSLYKMSFVKGVVGGVGGVIGATIVIALLLFVLSLVSNVPLVGNVAEKIQDTVESRQ